MEKQISIEVWIELASILLFFLIILILPLVPKYLLKRKIKKLKYEGKGVMKKARVLYVRERYVSRNKTAGCYLYRLEAKDRTGNIYRSEFFKNADHGGRTLVDMVIKYDGVTYDLGNKDEAIKQINDNIHRLEMELSNDSGFSKKRELKKDIEAMKRYIDIANEGPITPYLMCNGHKISVGDCVDVFVNPEKPTQYYFI